MTRRTPTFLLGAAALAACASPAPAPAGSTSASASAGAETGPVAPIVPDVRRVTVEGDLLPPMPVAVTSFGAATLDGHVYVVGGYSGTPHEYSREGQSTDVWRLPVDGRGAWERVGALPHGLQGLALVAAAGRLCRFGGNRALNAAGEDTRMQSVADAACWRPGAEAWQALPPMPEGRSSHDAAIVGDTVYVAGGWRLDGTARDGTWATELWALDLADPDAAWTRSEVPFTRRALGLAAAGDRLVALGGIERDGGPSSRLDVYDPATGRWSRGPDFPDDAFGVATVGVDGVVFASGRDGVLRRWAPGEAAWTDVETLAFTRFFHELVPAGDGALLAVGGISGMHTDGRTRLVERLSTRGATPGAVSVLTMPWPGEAKNRQAWFLVGEHLYAFGGNDSLEQHDFEPENFVAEGWRLHLPSLTVERIEDFPRARQSMVPHEVDGRGLAIGGFGHDGEEAVTHPEVFAYDFEAGTWEPRAGLPVGRTQFGLAEHGGKLWIFGGLDYDPRRGGSAAFEHVTSVIAAPADDPAKPFEDTGIRLPGPRRAFAGATHGDRYLVVGGMRERFGLVDDCVAFDFTTQAFEPLACPRATRLSAELVPVGEKLYLVGGSVRTDDGMATDRSIEVLDPATGRWELLLEALPFDTAHTKVLTFGDRLLLLSTQLPEQALRVALVETGAGRARR